MMPTREEILNMPAGREMDALIATKVMGWKVDDLTATSPTGSSNSRIPHGDEWLEYYSTDMTTAWLVVEKLMHDGFIWKSNGNEACGNLIYSFSFAKNDDGYEDYFQTYDSGITENNLPLAICRAALLAVQSASPTHDLP